MLPKGLISCYLIVCQRTLQEQDGVFSLIRIVDIFLATPIPELPVEKQAVQMAFIGNIKGEPGDPSEHVVAVHLIRPDGETKVLTESNIVLAAKDEYRDLPRGFNIVGEIGVVPKQVGIHYLALIFDGQEITRVPFTLRERATAEQKN